MLLVIAQLLLRFNFGSEPSPILWRSLSHELERTQIDNACWRIDREEAEQPTSPANTVTVEVQGKCEIPSMTVPWRPEPLGWVEVTGGHWLSRVHMDCTRIAEALEHREDNPLSYFSELSLARAMATVVRHELRHLVRQTREHARTGEFRDALAGRDLVLPFSESKCPR